MSEILHLDWQRVDFGRQVAWLDPGTTKNGDSRGIPLNRDVVQVSTILAPSFLPSEIFLYLCEQEFPTHRSRTRTRLSPDQDTIRSS